LLISLIIIPFYLPVLIFGAAAVRNAIDGISVNSPVAVLALFWLASILFAPLATAAALKVGLQE
jgi:heme exporter protein B